MSTFFVISGVLTIFTSLLIALFGDEIKGISMFSTIVGLFLFGFGVSLSIENGIRKTLIPAIEVYRGNTTLQVTYQDSVAIDSVVVYKK